MHISAFLRLFSAATQQHVSNQIVLYRTVLIKQLRDERQTQGVLKNEETVKSSGHCWNSTGDKVFKKILKYQNSSNLN